VTINPKIDPRAIKDAEAHALKLLNEGKPIESGWEMMRLVNLAANPKIGMKQLKVMRQCYFVGARQLFLYLMGPLQDDALPELDDYRKQIKAVAMELKAFEDGPIREMVDERTYDTNTTCPVCAFAIECSTALSGPSKPPAKGDVTVCGRCASFLMFEDGLALRLMDINDVAALPDEIRIDMERTRRFAKSRAK
jgi:hypothetical protein